MTEANTELRFLSRFPRPKFLPHGLILEYQRRVVGEFLSQKVEFAKSKLAPKRPLVESLSAQAITFVGGYMSLDGWNNARVLISPDPYIQTIETGELLPFFLGTRVAQGLLGAGIVVLADSWKRSLWRRENQG